jgi:transmembrane sensor
MRRDTGGKAVRAAFAEWLAADPRHGAAYDAIAGAWEVFDDLHADDAEAVRPDPALVRTLDAARAARQNRGKILRRGLIGTGIAASAAGAFFVCKRMSPQAPRFVEFSTGAGQRLTRTLADGSVLDLDANSTVRVALDAGRRDVSLLHGRVLFDVAHDARRPFVVTTGNGAVTVLGTLFTVEYRDNETSVALFRGRVSAAKLDAPKTAVDLLPGDAARISNSGAIDLTHHVDVQRALLWRQGRLVFENETLSRVVSRMNDYSADRIVVSDPAAARLRISGIFQAGHNDAFLDALRSYYGLAVTRRDRAVTIASPHGLS